LKTLVTGATGFVGSALVDRFRGDGVFSARVALRDSVAIGEGRFDMPIVVGDLKPDTDWRSALDGIQTVVHLAARVHVMRETATDSLSEFRRINVEGTVNLARQAISAGVRRFIFVSSIKVNGESTSRGKPFHPDDTPLPIDPYGISKYEAEIELQRLALESGMEVVIIRPPLVYGPGVKANFQSMIRWVWRGIPLPLGAVISNKRSLISLDNLVDFIVTCIDHPAAANQTFLVSDGESLSTAALLRRMGEALGRPARLIPVPVSLLKLGATMLGKPSIAQRLCGSLEVDIGKTRELLGWMPPISVDEGLRRTAAHWILLEQASRG
jgi:nucleoside-diphosphate-sugar epimerase